MLKCRLQKQQNMSTAGSASGSQAPVSQGSLPETDSRNESETKMKQLK
jgi:hypothetical protein